MLTILKKFSYSMLDDLQNLRKLASNLTEEFKLVSQDFLIGLGTFVDKVTLPYSYTDKFRISDPCADPGSENAQPVCKPAYSFRNEMDMSNQLSDFTETLDKLNVSGNIDKDEGGFDALMQVAACYNQFGFRNNSRKIVIFMTDQGSHIAGDGRLAGIFTPNDGNCHTGVQFPGHYSKSLDMDYPSIEQVRFMKLIENDIIPIFAVGERVLDLYKQISDHLTQLSSVGQLSEDGSNLVDVVRASLNRITTTINLVVLDALGVHVKIEPLCNQKIGSHACGGVKYDQTVRFNITFSFDDCTANTPEKLTIPIVVTGFSTILVEVTTQCKCECEVRKFDDLCMNNGHLVCGACHCLEGFYGDNCNCSIGAPENKDNLDKCTPKDSSILKKMFRTSSLASVSSAEQVCSSRGRCECGKCLCRQPETPPGTSRPYVEYGDFCECNNFECPKGGNGKVCSGEGFCDCGKCNCNVTSLGVPKSEVLVAGPACDCAVSDEQCKDEDGVVCSGAGECVCGKCQCSPKHRGKYCQICDLCGPLNCQTHVDCVLCRTLRLDADSGESCGHYCNSPDIDTNKYRLLEDAETFLQDMQLSSNFQLMNCAENNDNETNCVVKFYIGITNDPESPEKVAYEVLIDSVVWCADKEFNPIWMAIGIILGLLVPVVFSLVVWKLYTRYLDQQEYLKFEEINKTAQWRTTESPIYQAAVTTYHNPTYKQLKSSSSLKRGSSLKRNLSLLRRGNTKPTLLASSDL
ncbi:hypothetical protein ACHWQZ_G002508 [Mnemiopsis leidyi]